SRNRLASRREWRSLPSRPIACSTLPTLTPCCSTCVCRALAAWTRCTPSAKRRADALVIVVTGYGTVKSAVQAMKDGAYDYVTKPFSMEELRLLLERVAGHLRLKTESRVLRETIKSRQGFGNIIGRAPDMEKLYRIIAKA